MSNMLKDFSNCHFFPLVKTTTLYSIVFTSLKCHHFKLQVCRNIWLPDVVSLCNRFSHVWKAITK